MTSERIGAHEAALFSRRRFLGITAATAVGGGLLLGFGLTGCSERRGGPANAAPFAPSAFLRIDRAGQVTFVMPAVEMGQGTYTSIPMLIAEELEVDIDRVTIEHAPPDERLFANPLIGAQLTGASTSIRGAYVPLRQAGATARVMLMTAAAGRWRVDPSTCRAENGVVLHVPTGRELVYGDLVDEAAKLPPPERVDLKDPRDFRLIGTPHRRTDSPSKVDGSAKFGIDARLPAMKYAVLAVSPTFGGTLRAVDEARARAVPGVTQVVRLADAVAVVATDTWAAKQGLAAASPQWDTGPHAGVSTADIVTQLIQAVARPGATARRDGDLAGAMASATRTIQAGYQQPFLAHATMEPMNCTVQLTKEGCDVWVGTQVPVRTQAAVSRITGLDSDRIRIHNHLLGGGFGRRLEVDGTVRAVQIAQHVDGPVQVLWTREEDIQHDMYRPYYVDRLTAGLDAKGRVAAWSHRIAGSSIAARYDPAWVKEGIDTDAVDGSANAPYDLGAVHVEWIAKEPPGVPTAFWRGVGVTRGTFAVESFIDELAATANADPLAFRLALLEKNPRARAVLQIAADHAGWGAPLPRREGRGIALCIGFGSFIAQVAHVAVSEAGVVTPIRVICAVDCGIRINPDTVRAQMESGIIFGMSAALHQEISIKGGRVEQSNFADYRVLRINEVPQIQVRLVDSVEAPGGIGEPGTSCVMPALTNAIFAATGKRIRRLPIGDQAGMAT